MGSADPDEENSPALLLFAGWGGWGRRSGGASREEKEEERWRAGPGAPGLSGKPTARLPGGGGGARARAKPPPGQKRPRARSPCGRSRRRAAPPPGPCWRGPPPDSGVADCAAAGAYPAAKPQGESPVKTQNSVRLAAKTCADPRTSRERSGRAEIIGGTLPSSRRLAASTPSSPPLGRCARSCGVSLVVFHWCIF